MGFIESYKMAIKSIFANKMRSFLTMLGVIIGVASVIVAVAFAQGSTKSITDSIESLGTNLIQVSLIGRGSNRTVTYDDMLELAEENSDEIYMIAPQITSSATVKVGSKTRNTSLVGTSPEYEYIKSAYIQSGRFLLSFDIDYRQKVAIIGTAVAEDVFEGENPIGQTMKINGEIFKVVGLLQEKDDSQDGSEDDKVIIPVTVAQRMGRTRNISNYLVQAASSETVDSAMELISRYLTKVYSDENSFTVISQAQMLSTLDSITGTMMVVLGGIAAISLIVGGIGIMNIMLVSVKERTKEIGIRKAIGAKRRTILTQFLIEAITITGIGGLLGILTGISIIRFVLGGFNITTPVYSVKWMLISFSVSLSVGVVFGIFPAYKAAKLNPIEALRYE